MKAKCRLWLVFLLSIIVTTTFAHDIEVENADGVTIYYVWINNNTELEVSYKGDSYDSNHKSYRDNVVIPESVSYEGNTYRVTSIGSSAFSHCSSLISVTIPSSVTAINGIPFGWCSSLSTIIVASGNPKYDSRNSCNAIIETESNTLIQGCRSTVIPNSVTAIGEMAFYGHTNLRSIDFPDNLREIHAEAFRGCDLTTISLPNALTYIGTEAFIGCSNLSSIDISESSALLHIGNGAFKYTAWYDNQPSGLVYVGKCAYHYKGEMPNNTEIVIKEGTVSITDEAFRGSKGLIKVTLPQSTSTIGDGAFASCTSLKSINLTDNVTSIGNSAFYGCSALQEIGTVNTPIVGSIFSGCSELKSVKFGSNVKEISEDAFRYASQLKEITFSEGLETIGSHAFGNGEEISELFFPNTLKTIGSSAFGKFPLIKELTLPASLTCIDNWAFSQFEGLTKIVSKITDPSNVRNPFSSTTVENALLIIPKGTRSVYTNAGWRFSSMFEEGEEIAEKEFTDEQGIKYERWQDYYTRMYKYLVIGHSETLPLEIVIPATLFGVPVTNINDNSFKDCTSIERVTLPNSLTYISSDAFYGCMGISEIISLIEDPSTVSASFPDVVYENAVLQVPAGKKDVYANKYPWEKFLIYEAGSTPIKKMYTDEQGVVYTAQKSSEEYYYMVTSHINALSERITLPSEINGISVTSIDDEAFKGCTQIKWILVPATITTVSSNAFEGCALTLALNHETVGGWSNSVFITNVELGSDVKTINSGAFRDCTNLKSVSLPDGLTAIGEYAFYGCTSLECITLSENLQTIGNYAFYDCTSIKSVTVPKNVEMAYHNSNSPFDGCTSIESITIECANFGDWFRNMPNIKHVHLGAGVSSGWFTSDSYHPLYNCTGIESITVDEGNTIYDSRDNCNAIIETASNTLLTGSNKSSIPETVTAIGDCAFQLATGLTEVTIPAGVNKLGYGAFYGCTNLIDVYSYIKDISKVDCSSSLFNSNTKQTATLHVPYLKKNRYRQYETWSFTDIVEMDGTLEEMAVIEFADPVAKQACVSNWDVNEDGEICMGEAKFVTDTSDLFYYISNKADLVSFDEFKYFTNVTNIGNSTFYGCTGLESISIPSEVTAIGESAFRGCTKLRSIELPDGLLTIDSYAFSSCSSLMSISIPSEVTAIGAAAFSGCSSLKSISIPSEVTAIGASAFYGCTKLMSIELPDGLLTIDSEAFHNCSSLKSINLSEGLTSIGGNAFKKSGLNTMTIPSTVTSIGDYALAGDIIYCNLTTPISVGTLMSNASETILYVPEGCEEAFRQANGWKDFLIVGTGSEITDWSVGEVTAVVEEPGELRLALVEVDEEEITRLRLRGKLNSEDIKYLMEGAGKIANLESLDLSEVTFDYDGGCYYSKTEAYGDIWDYYKEEKYYLTEEEYVTHPSNGTFSHTSTTVYHSPYLAGVFMNKDYKHIVMPKNFKKAARKVLFNCKQLQSVEYPGGIDYVGESAFEGCTILPTVTLAETDTICNNAFSGCSMLQNVENISHVKSIGKQAFKDCKIFTGENGVLQLLQVDSIPDNAFNGCKMLNDVRLSDKLYYIGVSAFAGCTSLSAITLPNSLKSLSHRAFEDCGTLEDVTYSPELTKLDYTCFYNTPFMNNLPSEGGVKYMGTIALSYDIDSDVAATSPATLTFREGITYIVDNFIESLGSYRSNVTQLNLPSTLERIGEYAFYNSNVATVTLPEGLKEIESYAFYSSPISKLNLPESLTTIGDNAFDGIKITSLTYNLEEITGKNIFNNCTSLEKVTIGTKVQLLPEGIFSYCKALTIVKSEERIDGTPMDIGNDAFLSCTNLIKLTLPEDMVVIGDNAFYYCSSLKSFTTSESLETIGARAFANCNSLTSFNMNEGLKIIGDDAFWGCKQISAFQLPESIDSIGNYAFEGCTAITRLTIPVKTRGIGYNIIRECTNLTELKVYFEVPPRNAPGYYDGVILYVPDGCKPLYQEASDWNRFETILEFSNNDITARNKLAVADVYVPAGKTATISVGLTNDVTDFTAYQFDIMLPFGLTIDEDDIIMGTRYSSSNPTITFNKLAVDKIARKSRYRFVLFGLNGGTITGTEGELLRIIVHSSNTLLTQKYEAIVENAIFVQSDATKSVFDKVKFNVIVRDGNSGVIGDVNGDGEVDIADAVCIVNHVVGKTNTTFMEAAADANNDGAVDIADAVRIVNLVVGKINALSRPALRPEQDEKEPQ